MINYNEKTKIVNKFLDYVNGFKVSAEQQSDRLVFTVNGSTFSLKTTPTYTQKTNTKLYR